MVAFFGPDGAGKSTQAQLLIDYLRSKGFKVRKAWVRSTHTLAFLLWLLFRKFNLLRGEGNTAKLTPIKPNVSYIYENSYGAVNPITTSPPVINGPISRFLWSSIEVISLLPVVLLQVYLPLWLGYIVVAERYLVDSIASIAYFLNDERFTNSLYAKLLLKLIPKDTIFFFLDANYETIVKRRGCLAGPAKYTHFHRRIYSKIAPIVNAVYINTSRLSIEQASDMILQYLGFNQ
jgi:thymidylate kinase